MNSITDIANYFKVSRQSVHKHIMNGSIKAVKFGTLYKITDEEFTRIKREGVVLDKRPDKSK